MNLISVVILYYPCDLRGENTANSYRRYYRRYTQTDLTE